MGPPRIPYDYIGFQPRVHGVIFDNLGESDIILNNATLSS